MVEFLHGKLSFDGWGMHITGEDLGIVAAVIIFGIFAAVIARRRA
jgi:hypothetical protein